MPAVLVASGTTPPFQGVPHDVTIDVTVADTSPNEQLWSGTLPTGEAWTVRVTRVYDTISLRPDVSGASNGWSTSPVPRPPGQELGCCSPPSVVTADPNAAAMRLTRSNGDRYVIPLHDLPGNAGLRIAVIGVLDGASPLELIDARGNVLQSV